MAKSTSNITLFPITLYEPVIWLNALSGEDCEDIDLAACHTMHTWGGADKKDWPRMVCINCKEDKPLFELLALRQVREADGHMVREFYYFGQCFQCAPRARVRILFEARMSFRFSADIRLSDGAPVRWYERVVNRWKSLENAEFRVMDKAECFTPVPHVLKVRMQPRSNRHVNAKGEKYRG